MDHGALIWGKVTQGSLHGLQPDLIGGVADEQIIFGKKSLVSPIANGAPSKLIDKGIVSHPQQSSAGISPTGHPPGATDQFLKHFLHKIGRIGFPTC